jgi:hypothetical protein
MQEYKIRSTLKIEVIFLLNIEINKNNPIRISIVAKT